MSTCWVVMRSINCDDLIIIIITTGHHHLCPYSLRPTGLKPPPINGFNSEFSLLLSQEGRIKEGLLLENECALFMGTDTVGSLHGYLTPIPSAEEFQVKMNQGFWMAKGTGCLNDGEMACDNSSRIEPKRSHQWFMDGPEVELFPNKKQALEVPNNHLYSGVLNSDVSPWGSAPSFQSVPGHFSEQLFETETARTVGFDSRNISSVGAEKLNLGRKVVEDPFGNDSSFSLSMSHSLEDPRSGLTYGGFRKVKVSEVKDSENLMAVSMGHAYSRGNDNTSATAHAYNKVDDNSVSMALTYNKSGDNIISVGDTYERAHNSFISMGQAFNNGEESISVCQTYKENNNTISAGQMFNKGDNGIISIGQTYKADESSISTGLISKAQENTMSTSHAFNKGDNNILSMGHSYNKGESTIISFGGYDGDDVNASERLVSSYELLLGQTSVQKMEEINEKKLVNSNAEVLVNNSRVTTSATENVSKRKDDQKISKKTPPNNFPSNVRSLLSTGMLDGVPVKYIAWSREKELRGVIKGAGYLCGCQSCNFTKVINAYEFERHASCKTKHPNNHIYFENGKTVYGIVQELRSTPQNMLFDVIQTVTGSPINQKSFRLWKESFLAATRELQRIYGKDEGKQCS
ncbi:Jas TPL-binding domain containing protein [Trema orientale]|uniref:Jas TPL-binding domain containing protein n=1 Tax=Trema orientale TaxID=63057 RepID=A0A2P5FX97_TREOI|nr:Jas TPL-binding domain containing protein [Trema orientale]